MHITLDRNRCPKKAGCETCFSKHLTSEDFKQADCLVRIEDTGRPEIVFKVRDRDQSVKTFVVNNENIHAAQASWSWLWEQQAGPVI